jgi:dethiobiotin synthetase
MRSSLNFISSVERSCGEGNRSVQAGCKMRGCGLYVTGTDTGVGKTQVAAAIIRRLAVGGCRVAAYKPVASGVDPDGLAAGSDAAVLWEAAARRGTPADVCPQAFAAPISPPRSARAAGRSVDQRLIVAGLAAWRDSSDVVVVEGAGGLFSPLGDTMSNADLARLAGLPLVVVDAARLGAIGRTLAVVHAAAAAGLRVAAVVLSHVVPQTGGLDDPASDAAIARDSAIDLAAAVAPVPVAILGHGAVEIEPDLDWRRLAGG